MPHLHRINDHEPETERELLCELVELVRPISELAAMMLAKQREALEAAAKKAKAKEPADEAAEV